jgi:2-methylisocitrate lyase-like PEP mutase family enzyme
VKAAERFRQLLESENPVVAPGTFNALFARMIESAGFPAIYLSGAGVANSLLGRPDIGLVTLNEMVLVAEHICDVVDVPVIADADTGYGGPHNVARTVKAYERVGVAAIQIEDQVFPKRCGHFEGKEVVAVEEMLQRIEAVLDARSEDQGIVLIARTDARGPIGLDEAIDRARRYREAGADVLFVEAPRTVEELERIGSELSEWPLLANMVEFGKTPLMSAQELADLGFSLVIFPGSIGRASVKAADRVLSELASKGTTREILANKATFDAVNEILGLSDSNNWESDIAKRASR